MKRLFKTFAASLLFLTVTSLVGYFAYYTQIKNFWAVFGIASGILALSVVLTCIKKKATKIAAFFVIAVSMGFYLQSWYVNRGFNNSVWLILGVAALASAYMLIFVLPLLVPAINRHYSIYLTFFVVLSLAGYVALLVFTKTTWVSTLGFFGILQLSFILGSSFDCKDVDDEMQALLISSYSIAVCAVIILIVALGGDACDGCDCIGGDVASPYKGKKNDDLPPKLPPAN